MNRFDIQRFRAINKISQAELANYLNINSSYLSQVETGRRPLSDKLLAKILDNKKGWVIDSTLQKGDVTMINTKVLNTIISQQETIATLAQLLANAKEKSNTAQTKESAGCADAVGL